MSNTLPADVIAGLVESAMQTDGSPAALDRIAADNGLLFSELLEILKANNPGKQSTQKLDTRYKACSKCKASKPFAEFYADPNARDGLNSWCRDCNNHRSPTEARMLRTRARNRATATLVKKHEAEFVALYEAELALVRAEHKRLTQSASASGNSDAALARLKPGPKRRDQSDITERLDVARCPACHTHHDDKHVCPNCGDETPAQADVVKPYEIRLWALAEGIGPVPSRGPLPARIVQAYREAQGAA